MQLRIETFRRTLQMAGRRVFPAAAGIAVLFGSLLLSGAGKQALAQSSESEFRDLNLGSMDSFESPSPNWTLAGDVYVDLYEDQAIETEEGTGLLVNLYGGGDAEDLFTRWEHGDLDLELEFMMARGSNSGIYFQSRYELQLLDSWGVDTPRFGDMGGIYQWVDNGESGGGTAPRINAARAPGLWQHLVVRYRAPRFNEHGDKTTNARFKEVLLNGEVIHRNTEADRPTGGTVSREEVEEAPLRIQGTHGPVAFRNIRYRRPVMNDSSSEESAGERLARRVDIGNEPLVLHGFMNMDERHHTHTAAVAFPGNIHYAFDQNSGALLKVWKGEFVDLSTMWDGRGGGYLSLNEHAAISFGSAPSLAYLENGQESWPDTLQQGVDYRLNHYEIGDRYVTWSYRFDGIDVTDRFSPSNDNRQLRRSITVEPLEADNRLYLRIASAESLEWLPNGLIQVDDHTFYIKLEGDVRSRAWIRDMDGGRELIVPAAGRESQTCEYSFIW